MRYEIVVASGKGGTGKTFIASNLAYFLNNFVDNVLAIDADVEAPDLLIALGDMKKIIYKSAYYGSEVPIVDYKRCIRCWRCKEACKFDAIFKGDKGPIIDYDRCEGLGVCSLVCPSGAIRFKPRKTGEIIVGYSTYDIPVITGELELGGRNSGRLVYELKKRAYELTSKLNASYIVVDAAPGIGCPVVSSLAGADIVVVVVEPSPQSVKGARRLINLANELNVTPLLILNKYDLYPGYSEKIPHLLNIKTLGRISYSEIVVNAYTSMVPVLKLSIDSEISQELIACFNKLLEELK